MGQGHDKISRAGLSDIEETYLYLMTRLLYETVNYLGYEVNEYP